jgi:hypothetical protein
MYNKQVILYRRHSNSALSTSALFLHYQQKTKFTSIKTRSIDPHIRMLSSSPPTIDRPGNGDQCRLVSTPTTNGTQPVQAGGIVPGSDQPPLYLPDFLQNLIDHL